MTKQKGNFQPTTSQKDNNKILNFDKQKQEDQEIKEKIKTSLHLGKDGEIEITNHKIVEMPIYVPQVKFKPADNILLLLPVPPQDEIINDIVVPASAQKSPSCIVVRAGNFCEDYPVGSIIMVRATYRQINSHEAIMVPSGQSVEILGKEYFVMNRHDVLGAFETPLVKSEIEVIRDMKIKKLEADLQEELKDVDRDTKEGTELVNERVKDTNWVKSDILDGKYDIIGETMSNITNFSIKRQLENAI